MGILAAIAIPSVLGIIDNCKKDAPVANAQQMISAAKMAIASDAAYQTGTEYLTLKGLEDMKYLDTVDSPDNAYAKGATDTITAAVDGNNADSYVAITDGEIVGINLITTGSVGSIKYITKIPTAPATTISAKDIKRSDVLTK